MMLEIHSITKYPAIMAPDKGEAGAEGPTSATGVGIFMPGKLLQVSARGYLMEAIT